MKRSRSSERPPVEPPAPYVTEMNRGSGRGKPADRLVEGYRRGVGPRRVDLERERHRWCAQVDGHVVLLGSERRWPVGRGSRTPPAGGALSSRAGAGLGCRSSPAVLRALETDRSIAFTVANRSRSVRVTYCFGTAHHNCFGVRLSREDDDPLRVLAISAHRRRGIGGLAAHRRRAFRGRRDLVGRVCPGRRRTNDGAPADGIRPSRGRRSAADCTARSVECALARARVRRRVVDDDG